MDFVKKDWPADLAAHFPYFSWQDLGGAKMKVRLQVVCPMRNDNLKKCSANEMIDYEKKPECPVLCTGMNGQCWFGGVSPQACSAFSFEEAPTCGRGFFT